MAEEEGDAGEPEPEVRMRGHDRPAVGIAVVEDHPVRLLAVLERTFDDAVRDLACEREELTLLRPRRARHELVRRARHSRAADAHGVERVPDEGNLALEIARREATDPVRHALQARLFEEVGEAPAAPVERVASPGTREKQRDVASMEVFGLGREERAQVRAAPDRGPERVEEPVALQRVAERVRVEALQQHRAVAHGGAEEDAHLAIRERLELRDQLLAMFRQERVHAAEARLDGSGQLVRGELRTVLHAGPVVADRDAHAAPLHAHRVETFVGRREHRARRELTFGRGQAGKVDPGVVLVAVPAFGEQVRAQDGGPERGARRALDVVQVRRVEPRLEQRFEVDEDRMLARGEQVLVVKVGAVERVQQREIGPLPLEEAPQRLLIGTGAGADPLHPAVFAAVEHAGLPERGLQPARVQPAQELLKHGFKREGLRFVDDLEAGLEDQEEHRTAAAVEVGDRAVDLAERADLLAVRDRFRVGRQPLQQLHACGQPQLQALHGLMGKHRILLEDFKGVGLRAEVPDEIGEALFRRLTLQAVVDLEHVHLDDQRAVQQRGEVIGKMPGEDARDLRLERRLRMRGQDRARFELEAAPEVPHQRLEQREKAAAAEIGARGPGKRGGRGLVAAVCGGDGVDPRRTSLRRFAEKLAQLVFGHAERGELLLPQARIIRKRARRFPAREAFLRHGAVERPWTVVGDPLRERLRERPSRAVQLALPGKSHILRQSGGGNRHLRPPAT
jgi:hypothetical protein